MGGLLYPNLDASIGKAEGFGTPGAIPTLANNPGDIIAGPFATAHGAVGSVPAAGGQQIAYFPDAATGLAATDALAASKIQGGATDPASFAQSWLGTNAAPSEVTNWASVIQSNFPGATAPSATSASGTSVTSAVGNFLGNVVSYTIFGLPLAEAAAFILGLIVLAGAIFLFKPTQQIVVSGAKKAAAAVAV